MKLPLPKTVSFSLLSLFSFVFLAVPTSLAATVTLSWDHNSPPPDGYRVFCRRIDQAYDYQRPAWSGTANTCTIENLSAGAEYAFVVRAFEGAAESSDSNEVVYVSDPPPSSEDPKDTPAEAGADQVPPTWNGTTDGIALAADALSGGAVRVEFDTAIDAVDGAELKFNVYYARRNSWRSTDWMENNVIFDAPLYKGGSFAHAVIVDGLTNNTDYTFGVRVEDRSGNEDANNRVLNATPTAVANVDENPSLITGTSAAASSLEGAGLDAAYAVDGDSQTRWSSRFSDNQWIYIDLGGVCTVSGVTLDWEAAYGSRYAIQLSTDAANWTTVHTEYSGNGGMDEITFAAADARYVRMLGIKRATPYGYSLYEFQVYGAAAGPAPAPAPARLPAPGAIRSASASSLESAGLAASNAVDGDSRTRWSSRFSDNQWIYIDLGGVCTVSGVTLDWEAAYGSRYAIQLSTDAANWTTVYTEYSGNGGRDEINFASASARYVRMLGIKRATIYGYSLYEFMVR